MELSKVLEKLIISLFALGIMYYAGYTIGKHESLDIEELAKREQQMLANFELQRNNSCLAWWFDDSSSRIKDAQVFMCQNKSRWKEENITALTY